MHKELKPVDRARMLANLREGKPYDVVVIGGGATGLGVAVDAATRGLRTLIVDAQDFCAGTSSCSTKLIHGGVRYLANPRNWSLVHSALQERRLLLQNAPKLVKAMPFVVPCYRFFDWLYYGLGLTLYTALSSGGHGIGPMSVSGRVGALSALPGVNRRSLKGSLTYYDAQFDDARLGFAVMLTAHAYGADVINYMQAVEMTTDGRRIQSVTLRDQETQETFTVQAKVFFNCAGPWVDSVRHLVDVRSGDLVRLSRGSHIMVDRSFMPADNAMLVPKTTDGRVLFCIPWHGALMIGTTEVEQGQASFDLLPSADEINFIINNANRYFTRKIRREDVLASFAGLRPLFNARRAGVRKGTASMSREHVVLPEFGNMITVAGGKWTSYRAMAEDAMKIATQMRFIPRRGCMTRSLPLLVDEKFDPASLEQSAATASSADDVREKVCEYARYAVAMSGARTAKDVLWRRLRLGVLHAKRAQELMPAVEAAVAEALNKS